MTSPKSFKLKPVDGRDVPLENGAPWPTELKNKKPVKKEIEVPNTRYWRRRIKDEDVIDVDAEAKVAAKAKVAAEAKKKSEGGSK